MENILFNDQRGDYIKWSWKFLYARIISMGIFCGAVANVLYYDIVINEIRRQSYYYVHFQTITHGKSMNPLIIPP